MGILASDDPAQIKETGWAKLANKYQQREWRCAWEGRECICPRSGCAECSEESSSRCCGSGSWT